MELTHDVDGREVVAEVARLFAGIRARGAVRYEDVGAEAARRIVAASIKLQGPAPDIETTEGNLAGVPVRGYLPRVAGTTVIAYLHGGGWVTGDLEVADGPCRQLAVATGCEVVSIGYRRAPEHRFPAAHDDAHDAVAALREKRPDARMVVVGDSAGANLAATVTLRLRRQVDGLVLLYPAISPPGKHPTASMRTNAEDPILPASTMAWFWDSYRGPGSAPVDGRLDPTAAGSLVGHPPALVVTCGLDVLHDEGARYARLLAAAGTDVRHHDEPGMVHGYLWLASVFPTQVGRALDLVRDWIRSTST